MSTTGRAFRQAVRNLTDHLNRTINRTLSQRRLIASFERGSDYAVIHYREAGQAVPVEFNTPYGLMHLSLRLHCVPADDDDGAASLRTVWYRHALRPDEHREPVFRWEYVREPEGDDALWARHHLQGPRPSIWDLNM